MSVVGTGFSAIGKLVSVVIFLAAFFGAMTGVVYMSLSGEEIKVPEITGRDYVESEKELAALGLKLKRRADRPSVEKMNTILEQLPKAGETVKTGQLILVVVSKAGVDGEETPKSLIKDIESDDTKKIEEMISDKPKKPKTNSNTNVRKKAETTRDVNASDSSSDSNSVETSIEKTENSNKPVDARPGDKTNKNTSSSPTTRPLNIPPRPGTVEARPRTQATPKP